MPGTALTAGIARGSIRGVPDTSPSETEGIIAVGTAAATGERTLTGDATVGRNVPRGCALVPTGTRLYARDQHAGTFPGHELLHLHLAR